MLVGSAVRRVAIVGGVRIPFARSYSAYASVGNQDMLTAALRGLVERFRLQGERLGDVAAGAVIKHSKDYNLVRECVLVQRPRSADPGARPAARLRHQPRGGDSASATRSRSARSRPASPAASTPSAIAPIVYPRSYQQLLLRELPRPQRLAAPVALAAAAAAPLQAGAAGGGRAAHRAVDGPEHASSWPSAGRSRAPSRTSSPTRVT